MLLRSGRETPTVHWTPPDKHATIFTSLRAMRSHSFHNFKDKNCTGVPYSPFSIWLILFLPFIQFNSPHSIVHLQTAPIHFIGLSVPFILTHPPLLGHRQSAAQPSRESRERRERRDQTHRSAHWNSAESTEPAASWYSAPIDSWNEISKWCNLLSYGSYFLFCRSTVENVATETLVRVGTKVGAAKSQIAGTYASEALRHSLCAHGAERSRGTVVEVQQKVENQNELRWRFRSIKSR